MLGGGSDSAKEFLGGGAGSATVVHGGWPALGSGARRECHR